MRPILTAALAALLGGAAAAVEPDATSPAEVPIAQVPEAVRETIERETGTDRLTRLAQDELDGRAVYTATLSGDGRERTLAIDPSGELLIADAKPAGGTQSGSPGMTDATGADAADAADSTWSEVDAGPKAGDRPAGDDAEAASDAAEETWEPAVRAPDEADRG